MPFIPHTDTEIKTMLAAIGANSIDDLFDEIPASLRIRDLPGIPEGLSEMQVSRLIQARSAQDHAGGCFIGAGAYDHHIPCAVLDLISRGEFLTAYTPYQAEASQGTLQLIYEYQTMMASLTGMDVSNASLYEGASALAEAVLMAVRLNKGNRRQILMPASVHPSYRAVVHSIVKHQQITLIALPYDASTGQLDREALDAIPLDNVAALVIPQPNFFGVLEDVDACTDWAHAHQITPIALVNPMSLALLKEPGQWGEKGADIVCGEGQPLGVPMASGGPYFGFLCCKQAYVRQMPGRIVGRTTELYPMDLKEPGRRQGDESPQHSQSYVRTTNPLDNTPGTSKTMGMEGKPGFTLTLQAREQHIRRSKATSNICTNQGLMVTAATIYMSLLGPEGLRRVASSSHHNAVNLYQQLLAIPGIEPVFTQPFFHEFVVRLKKPVSAVLDSLANEGIQGGFDLTPDYPRLGNCLLICTTETKTEEDLASYVAAMKKALQS